MYKAVLLVDETVGFYVSDDVACGAGFVAGPLLGDDDPQLLCVPLLESQHLE